MFTLLRMALLVVSVALPAVAAEPSQRPAGEPPRQRPPAAFACDRNDLTVFTGMVIGYRRTSGRTSIRLRTDWDTTEEVVLRHTGTDDPSRFFRIEGRPFSEADWSRIERSRGEVRTGVRASAWVCADGSTLVDWHVPSE